MQPCPATAGHELARLAAGHKGCAAPPEPAPAREVPAAGPLHPDARLRGLSFQSQHVVQDAGFSHSDLVSFQEHEGRCDRPQEEGEGRALAAFQEDAPWNLPRTSLDGTYTPGHTQL